MKTLETRVNQFGSIAILSYRNYSVQKYAKQYFLKKKSFSDKKLRQKLAQKLDLYLPRQSKFNSPTLDYCRSHDYAPTVHSAYLWFFKGFNAWTKNS